MSDPAAPDGLSDRTAALWVAVVAEYDLSPAELELLRSGCIALDRADAAGAIVEAEGVTVADRYGTPKAHPAVDVEHRHRALFARIVGQLGVRVEPSPASTSGRRPHVAAVRAS